MLLVEKGRLRAPSSAYDNRSPRPPPLWWPTHYKKLPLNGATYRAGWGAPPTTATAGSAAGSIEASLV